MRATDQTKPRIGAIISICMLLLLASCSIPTNDTVEALPVEGQTDLVFGTTTSSTVPDVVEEGDPRVALYFVGANEQLERVTRIFPPGTKVSEALAALVQPLPEEVAQFDELTSRITEDMALVTASKDDVTGTQTIRVQSVADLRTTVETEPARARLIVSQIVCTVVGAREDITGVRLVDETDAPIEVNDDDGSLITGPARPSNFNDCQTGADILAEQIEAEEAEQEEEGEEGEEVETEEAAN